jgi:hypothetical protein
VHPSISVGITPQMQWVAGDQRTTPKGQLLGGVNALTYWCSEGVEGEGFDLTGAISSHLRSLEVHVHGFQSSG